MILGKITGKDQKVRNDHWGSGEYGSRRKKADGSSYSHKGTDYVVKPGQKLYAPYTAVFARIAYPYSNNKAYSGALFVSKRLDFKIFYFRPNVSKGERIEKGQVIGIAQDISARYGPDSNGNIMDSHIHFEIVRIDPELLTDV